MSWRVFPTKVPRKDVGITVDGWRVTPAAADVTALIYWTDGKYNYAASTTKDAQMRELVLADFAIRR